MQWFNERIMRFVMRGGGCLLGLWALMIQAQEPEIKFDRISIEQGLSENFVYALAQDPTGFIWLGTQDGLNRYDGYTMRIYRHQPDNPTSLSNSYINALTLDSRGILWIGTNDGLNWYDTVTEQFHAYRHAPNNPNTVSQNTITALSGDTHGFLWIGTDSGGLNRLELATGNVTRYRHDAQNPNSLSHDQIKSVYADRHGLVWIGTNGGGLNRFDPAAQQFTWFRADATNPQSLSHDIVTAIAEDGQGQIWIGTDGGGVNRLNPTTSDFTVYRNNPADRHSLSHNNIFVIYCDPAGTLWIGTNGGGLNRYEAPAEQFFSYQTDPANPRSLSHNVVRAIQTDAAGILWLGTASGANLFDRAKHKFPHYAHHPGQPGSLSHNMVWSLYQDRDGTLWAGTFGGGLNQLDAATGEFHAYRYDPADVTSLGGDIVYGILEDSFGTLWVGTETGGLNAFDRTTRRFTRYQHDPANPRSLSHNHVWPIYEDRARNLWVGTFGGGLNKFDRATGEFTRYMHDPANPQSLCNDSLGEILEDRQGNLWIATFNGLSRFDPATGRWRTYVHDPDDPHSLSNDTIAALHEDPTGTLWVGTLGGLNKFDPVADNFTRYTKENGLPNDVIIAILEDASGTLWLSTFNGLARFDPRTLAVTVYDASDGLQSNRFSKACYQAQDGKMYLGGINGFNAFYPRDIADSTYLPPVVLTDFQIFNRSVPIGAASPLHQAIPVTRDLTLSYRDAVFSFEFAALHYSAPPSNRYAYQMAGVDPEWVLTDAKRRFVTYTNLDSGHYTFRVKGTNSDGLWNETGAAIALIITPPWWQTWWFRGGIGLLAIGLIVGGYRWRVNAMTRHNRELARQVAERTQELAASNEQFRRAKDQAETANRAKSEFLSNMSHELRTPLNGILGYAQILQRTPGLTPFQQNGLTIIQHSGDHLLTLINDILDLAKIEARKLDLVLTNVPLATFLQGVTGIILMRAQQKGLAFHAEMLSPLPTGIRADEKRLRQVLLNLLGNAVKFTDAGEVHLRVGVVSDDAPQASTVRLRFEVRDTGIGIAPDQLPKLFQPFEQGGDAKQRAAGTGLGLAISQQIVRLLGSVIQVESTPGQGSVFWFEANFPIGAIQAVSAPRDTRTIRGYAGPRRTLLVVDDKIYNRAVILDMLTPLGFQCIEAENGQELLSKADRFHPDLILTDLVMPVKTGFEAVQELRQQPAMRQIPMIAMTASVFAMNEEQSRLAGCDAFLPKPVEMERLLALLHTSLQLEWIYEDAPAAAAPQNGVSVADALLPPPAEEMEALFELAMIGDMLGIQQRAASLEHKDAQYQPFARKLQQFAAAFQDKQLLSFVKSYLERKA